MENIPFFRRTCSAAGSVVACVLRGLSLVSDVHYYSAAGHDGFDGSAGFMEGQYHAGKITGSGDRICKRQNTSRTISGPILYG